MTESDTSKAKDNIKRVAIYARVSTARQEDEKTIETQLSAVREYITKEGWGITDTYKDEGWSGTILERPELDRLREDARRRMFDAVVLYDPDRLARVYWMQAMVIDELSRVKVQTLFVTVPPPKNDEDNLMQVIRGGFAMYERTKISERFRLGKLRKVKEGHVMASEAPFGYTLIRKKGRVGDANFKQTHYEINDREAHVVRMIFQWVADEGLTLRKVIRRLQEASISPRHSDRGVWSTSTLSTLVRNRTYIGESHYGASRAVEPKKLPDKSVYRRQKKSSREMRPESEWILVKVPALFESASDRVMFDRAQEQLKRNYEMSKRNKKNEYLLAGRIRCVCGRSRAGEGPKKGRYRYYRCTSRVHDYPLPPSCPEKGVNAIVADGLVWDELSRLMTSPEAMRRQIEAWYQRVHSGVLNSALNMAPLEKELVALRTEEERYVKAYGAGIITLEKLDECLSPVKSRIMGLEGRISQARADTEHVDTLTLPETHELEAFAAMYAEALRDLNFDEKQAIVRRTIGGVVGSQSESHGELRIHGSIPLNSYEFQPNHRYRRSAKRGEIHAF
jgi:site-specific DNA recombinase